MIAKIKEKTNPRNTLKTVYPKEIYIDFFPNKEKNSLKVGIGEGRIVVLISKARDNKNQMPKTKTTPNPNNKNLLEIILFINTCNIE